MNKLKQNPTELERIVKNHLVRGLVKSEDLADDLVGPSVALTKLRSNVYHSEDRNWKDVKVSIYLNDCSIDNCYVEGNYHQRCQCSEN